MKSPRHRPLNLEPVEDRLLPSLSPHGLVSVPPSLPAEVAIARFSTDLRVDGVGVPVPTVGLSRVTAQRPGFPTPDLLADVRARAEAVHADLAAAPGTDKPWLAMIGRFVGSLTQPGEDDQIGKEQSGNPEPVADRALLSFVLRLPSRELPPTPSSPLVTPTDPLPAGALDPTPLLSDPLPGVAAVSQGVGSVGGAPTGWALVVGTEDGSREPLPRPGVTTITSNPVDVGRPPEPQPQGPPVPIEEEPIRAEVPRGLPLAGLVLGDVAALEESARTVLSHLPDGAETVDALAGPEQYAWLTAAVLVTAAAGYTLRVHRARAGDRVTLGTDSVLALREERRRGGRTPA
jgi:hypothetical protein